MTMNWYDILLIRAVNCLKDSLRVGDVNSTQIAINTIKLMFIRVYGNRDNFGDDDWACMSSHMKIVYAVGWTLFTVRRSLRDEAFDKLVVIDCEFAQNLKEYLMSTNKYFYV